MKRHSGFIKTMISKTKRLAIMLALCLPVVCYGQSVATLAQAQVSVISTERRVDLGLSVYWAGSNLGARMPQEDGHYYAWGETEPKETYLYENCANRGYQMPDISGDEACDAARAKLGAPWRMPTKGECEELRDRCKWTWLTFRGRRGYKVTGPNGRAIFVPASGYREGDKLSYHGNGGTFWSSTPDPNPLYVYYATCFDYNNGFHGTRDNARYFGMPIRPVCDKKLKK